MLAPSPAARPRRLGRASVLVGLVLLALAAFASLSLGAAGLGPAAVARALGTALGEGRAALDPTTAAIVLDIRLPRAGLAILVGAALGLSGAVMQGLFRNPLADPGLVGVSSGAALAAVTVIVLGRETDALLAPGLGPHLLPVAAFVGGLAATLVLKRLATVSGRTSVTAMLLVGIALTALFGALTGLLVFVADDGQLRELTFWTMGGLGGATWVKAFGALPLMLPLACAAPFMARGLNAAALGEAEAFHLGIDVERLKRLGVLAVAASVGAAVAVSGIIGFVGLLAPHLLRVAVGPDHRALLPASALLGATLLLLADLGARTLVAPAELPIGILTACLGAPVFLWLVLKRRATLGA